MTAFASCTLETPVGLLTLEAGNGGLQAIRWPSTAGVGAAEADRAPGPSGHPVLEQVWRQLVEYFRGERRVFDLPLAPVGTPFQIRVWDALREIPYGEVRSYAELAARIGRPSAARAVGAANGKNPLPIVVPCHRVIGANGQLTGFAGGLEAKRWLLDHERGGPTGRSLAPSLGTEA